MRDFFGLVLKHKKLVAFVMIVLVCAGVFMPSPQIVSAAGITDVWNAVKNLPWFLGPNGPLFIVGWLYYLVARAAYQVANFSSQVFTYVLSEMMQDPSSRWSITRGVGISSVFLVAWSTVKSFANIIIVLMLIASAVMMILRLWADRAKQLLPQIIIAALLINFSVVFIGLTIDASNMVIRTLAVGGQGEADLVLTLNRAHNRIVLPVWNNAINSDGNLSITRVMDYNQLEVVFTVMYLMVAFCFFYFTLIFIQRYFVLAALFILSPLAFVLRVFPNASANKLWGDWWHNFIKNCFSLIPVAFFLRLSITLLNNPAMNWSATQPADLVRLLFNFLIVLGFLFFGLRLAAKTAGPIADAIMSAVAMVTVAVVEAVVTGGASLELSASGLASAAGKMAKSGAESVGSWAASGARKATEAATGTDAFGKAFGESKVIQDRLKYEWAAATGDKQGERLYEQKRLQEEKQKMTLLKDEELAEIANTAKVGYKTAAAAGILADKKKFFMVQADKREEVAENAVAYGVKKSTITDQHPELLTDISNKDAYMKAKNAKEIAEEQALIATGLTPEEAKKGARRYIAGGGYKVTNREIKIAQEQLHQEKVRERTLGNAPVTDQDAKNKLIEDRLESERIGREAMVRFNNPRASEAALKVLFKEQLNKEKAGLLASYKPSATDIAKAKEALIKERGTPEGAAKNGTTRAKVRALNPELSEEEITHKIQKDEYQKYHPDFTNLKIEEIAKIANEEPQTSKGTRALEEVFKQKREDLLKPTAAYTGPNAKENYIKDRLQTAQVSYASNVIDEAKKVKAERAAYDTPGKERLVAQDSTPGRTQAQKEAAAAEELVHRAFQRMEDVVPKNDDDKVKKAIKAIQDSGGLANSEAAQIIENMAEKGTIGKLAKALGGLDRLGTQIEHITKTFGSSAIKDAVKSDYRLAKYDTAGKRELMFDAATGAPTGVTDAEAERQLVDKAAKKINPGSLRKDVSPDAITIDLVERLSGNIIQNSNKNEGLSPEKIKKFKDLLSTIDARRTYAALTDPDAYEKYDELYDAIDKLK